MQVEALPQTRDCPSARLVVSLTLTDRLFQAIGSQAAAAGYPLLDSWSADLAREISFVFEGNVGFHGNT